MVRKIEFETVLGSAPTISVGCCGRMLGSAELLLLARPSANVKLS